jgi:hypothetical protein
MELFDIIKTAFNKKGDWDKVSNSDKARNFFMLNRIMSIQFPIQANQFNKLKINPYPVADWWNRTLSNHYTRVPNWIYTKTIKNKDVGKVKADIVDFPETEKFIMEKYEVSLRELKEIKLFFPDRYNNWITSINQQMGTTFK